MMAVVYTTQYQPISNAETCANAALTVRVARDFIDALNNAKRYAMVDKVLTHLSPACTASDPNGSTDEVVVQMFAPRIVPQGFTNFAFAMSHKPVNGDGQTTWRLYSMPSKYRGPAIVSSAMVPSGSTNASITTDAVLSNAWNVHTNTVEIVTATDDTVWLMLTAQNNVAESYSKYATVDAWPVMP